MRPLGYHLADDGCKEWRAESQVRSKLSNSAQARSPHLSSSAEMFAGPSGCAQPSSRARRAGSETGPASISATTASGSSSRQFLEKVQIACLGQDNDREALTTQGSLTRGFRPDLVWAVLKRRNAEAPQGIEELGAR